MTTRTASLNDRARRRLLRELAMLNGGADGGVPGVSAGLRDDTNVFVWTATICGPDDCAYAGALLPLELRFPDDYPRTPPTATFKCPMFHPNVYPDGRVCVSILDRAEWSPEMTAEKVLLSLRSLLAEPNPDSPANMDAAVQLRNDPSGYAAAVIASLYEGGCLQ